MDGTSGTPDSDNIIASKVLCEHTNHVEKSGEREMALPDPLKLPTAKAMGGKRKAHTLLPLISIAPKRPK